MRAFHYVGAALVSALMAGAGQAGVIFALGNNPQPGEQNVLLDSALSGTSILGTTNQTKIGVQFSSTTDKLTAPANGQARIEASDGLINSVTISIPGGFFSDLIINPFKASGSGAATLSVLTNESTGGTQIFTKELTLDKNGQNFVTITTEGGATITSVTLTVPDGFEQLKQERISGAALNGPPGGAPHLVPVPEPASLSLFMLACASVLGYATRRRRIVREFG